MNARRDEPLLNDGKATRMGLWGAVSIGVGSMIGASIFSVFGVGASIAGDNLPYVFVVSGALALLVAYSYAKLGSKVVSNAGPIEFILQALGDSVVTGALGVLFCFTYIVSIALFARAFAGYFQPTVGLTPTPLTTALVEFGVIASFTVVGLLGAKVVARSEFTIVVIKVSVLCLFIALGIWTVRPEWISPTYSVLQMGNDLNAIAVFFLSYMGFGLITNASEDIDQAEKNVPRAMYLSVLIATIIYVLVAVVTIGNLPLEAVVRARENALAEAARPFLGTWGYFLVSVGALFSISSALNATLFGGANIAYALAREGELPETFERKLWFGSTEGLYLTSGLGLGLALLFDLGALASMTSAVVMVVYLFVLVSHYRLTPQVGGSRLIIVFAFLSVLLVFVILMHYQWVATRTAFYTTWISFAGALVVEFAYRTATGRTMIVREVTGFGRAVEEAVESTLRLDP